MTIKNRQDEHFLVCLSASPSNKKVIHAAAEMSAAFSAKLTAVYVEAGKGRDNKALSNENLRENIKLATECGAKVVVLYGGKVTEQIAEYARISGATKIILGRSYTKKMPFHKKESFSEQLLKALPDVEIHLIGDAYTKKYSKKFVKPELIFASVSKEIGVILGITAVTTAISLLFNYLGLSESNAITIYILGVLLTALITEKQICSFIAALLSVVCFNFFFTAPFYSLHVYDPNYIVTFFIMFISGFITAFLAKKVKAFGRDNAQRAYRTELLLEASQRFQAAEGEEKIAEALCTQIVKLLKKDVVFYRDNPATTQTMRFFPAQKGNVVNYLDEKEEIAVASWCYKNHKRAGATTDTLPGARGFYMAVRNEEKVYGVVGIFMDDETMTPFDKGVLSTMLNEAALTFEKEETEREKNQALIQMKQEQLRANLLRSISHDLRTPLTAISGNAGMLLEPSYKLTEEKKTQLYEDIYDDSVWLYQLVENLLSITRIENGGMKMNMSPELVDEVIQEAITHVRRRKNGHDIRVRMDDEFLMAVMDAKLIMQLIVNLVDNAIKYTPPGSYIEISAVRDEKRGRIVISVADNGQGIEDENKENIFQMFFSGAKTLADSTRSMGVGLSLCKSIAAAHGSDLKVKDNQPHGTIFYFDLKEETLA